MSTEAGNIDYKTDLPQPCVFASWKAADKTLARVVMSFDRNGRTLVVIATLEMSRRKDALGSMVWDPCDNSEDSWRLTTAYFEQRFVAERKQEAQEKADDMTLPE